MSHYMTQEEREQLEILYNEERLKAPAIARRMGFCKQTIYNELNIGIYEHDFGYYSRKRYSADKAGQIHRYRQTNKGDRAQNWERPKVCGFSGSSRIKT